MYAIDYDSLERARAKDRVKALRKVHHNAASACLDEIEAVNPDYYDQIIEAMHEPIGDEQRGRIVEYKACGVPVGQYSGKEAADGDHADEPLDYCYEQQERHGAEGLLPSVDGWYDLPAILGNAIYYKPTAAEVARAEHNRRYGITASDNGIYDILFDKSDHHRPRGGKSGRPRRSAPKTTRAQRVEAILARRNKA
jgi:hypothetical protein